MARVLLLTVDLDLPDAPISGGVLRVRQLKRHLAALGHEVVVSMPFDRLADLGAAPSELAAAHPEGQPQVAVEQLAPDVILCEQWHLAAVLGPQSAPLWLDLHGSLLGENAFRQAGSGEAHARYDQEARAKLRAFGDADVVTCAGARQRLYFRGWRAIAGRSFEDWEVVHLPLAVEPSFSDPLPAESAGDGCRLVYAGNLWPWIDLGSWLPTLCDVLADRPGFTIDFFVDDPLQHRDGASVIAAAGAGEGWRRLVAEGTATVSSRLPHPEFVARIGNYDAAIDLFSWNSERELALTTRSLEYLGLGLPVIYPAHSELAETIAAIDPRWVVSDVGRAALEDALDSLVATSAENRARRATMRAVLERRDQEAMTRCADVMGRLVDRSRIGSGEGAGERRLVSLANGMVRRALAEAERRGGRQAELAAAATARATALAEELDAARQGWQQREHELEAVLEERTRRAAELAAESRALEQRTSALQHELGSARDAANRASQQHEAERRALEDRLDALVAASERSVAALEEAHAAAERRMSSHIRRVARLQVARQTGAQLAAARPGLRRRGIGRRFRLWLLFLDHLMVRLYLAVWQRLHRRRVFPGM